MPKLKTYEVQVTATVTVSITCTVDAPSMSIAEDYAGNMLCEDLDIDFKRDNVDFQFDIGDVEATVISEDVTENPF